MEDQSKFSEHKKLPGLSEVFRLYYNRERISFDEFLYIEYLAISTASLAQWKIFTAFPILDLGPLMICKN